MHIKIANERGGEPQFGEQIYIQNRKSFTESFSHEYTTVARHVTECIGLAAGACVLCVCVCVKRGG